MCAIHVDRSFYSSFTKNSFYSNDLSKKLNKNKKRAYHGKKNDFDFYFISQKEIEEVVNFIDYNDFLPKKYWGKSVKDFIVDGLQQNIYKSLVIRSPDDKRVISYLDFRFLPDNLIEIGFCFTAKEYRNQGCIKSLMQKLLSLYEGSRFTITTHEKNHAMQQAILALGFKEQSRTIADRINGESTIAYLYVP